MRYVYQPYVYGQLQWVNFNFISNSKVQMKRSKITESDISASDEKRCKGFGPSFCIQDTFLTKKLKIP